MIKETIYKYTIQIAAFLDPLAILYPDQKEISVENKKKWFPETMKITCFTKHLKKIIVFLCNISLIQKQNLEAVLSLFSIYIF